MHLQNQEKKKMENFNNLKSQTYEKKKEIIIENSFKLYFEIVIIYFEVQQMYNVEKWLNYT